MTGHAQKSPKTGTTFRGTTIKPLPPERLLKAIRRLQNLAGVTKDPERKAKYLADVRNLSVLLKQKRYRKAADLGKVPPKPGLPY